MDFSGIIDIDLWLITLLSGDHSPFVDSYAMLLTNGWMWMLLYIVMLMVVIRNNETIPQIAILLGSVVLCLLLTEGVDAAIVKPLVNRLRPLNDPSVRPLLTLVKGVGADDCSFFSAHAANTMVLATFMALLIRNKWSTIALSCWALLLGWTRIYLCMHYPSDVVVGWLWGLIVGCVVYTLYLRIYNHITPRLHFMSAAYTRSGYAIKDIFMMINVMLMTMMACIIIALWMRR